MSTVRLAIIDDQVLFRQSLAALLSSSDLFALMEFDDAESFLKYLSDGTLFPELILLDMELPGMNGMELCSVLQKNHPGIRVVILSMHANERLIAKMIEKGASGYLVKNCDKAELLNAIHTVNTTGFYISQQVLRAIQKNAGERRKPTTVSGIAIELSKREKEILALICSEMNAAEISEKLFISIRTVEGHRNNLLQKTGCRNIAGLVLFAVKHGYVDVATY